MNNHDRDRIARLQKRLDYLRYRIYEAEKEGHDLTFDKAEAGALEWAIRIIEDYFKLVPYK